ncbi:MAG: nickel-type superoxide dismutase maturation protease [Egibacteraceae bacterium]
MGLWETCRVALIVTVGFTLARLRRYEVTGTSMAPTLLPGDRLLIWRTRSVRPGQLVLARDPRQPTRVIVKRVTAEAGPPRRVLLTLRGDHAAGSTDSRTFGAVPRRLVIGRVAYRYAPSERRDVWKTLAER